ncbi:glycosyltransferase family 9 protein [Falsiroseomonas tokyonensis]|uniref:Glycosyltransferase family 9 protein n=1 Tax=Falsiroseomonas tokyonensis TaxID=430521 RepID=A0ABV7BKZ0_9PROT|nr:glycosyltransferase family 9 protein [Falsiroseomonas tokyonensis]MBU8536237.1 glycosyltransferase family 9 protein [Falsiroseomonas tokyonensis]
MRILFVTATRIGDAVLSTGLLDHLLRTHPGARITVACGPAAAGVFARMPGLERLIVLAKRRFSLHWLDLWRQVATTRWDLVVDLRASALAWMVPARKRLTGKGGRRPGHRLTHLGALMGLAPPPLPVVWTAPEDETRAETLLPGGPWLVLGPTANWVQKVWPAERFVNVAQALTAPGGALAGARIAVLGGPGTMEREMAAPVLAAFPDAVDLVGRLSLPEVAAVMRRAALFLGNDSGLMHLAAAAGAPTLGLFGRSSAAEYGPCGPRALAVEADGPPFESPMTDLPQSRVLAAANRLLAA